MDREKSIDDDDTVSFCGSFSGETFSSTRRRKLLAPLNAPVHLDKLADKLKGNAIALFEAHKSDDRLETNKAIRWNTSFHQLRFVVCAMAGFSFGAMIFLRYVITVAILRMVDQSALYAIAEHHQHDANRTTIGDLNHNNATSMLPTPSTIETIHEDNFGPGGEFLWDNEIQQMIMSWYMFAYTIPQVPCTKLATMIGARWAIPIFLSTCIISNALTPMFAYFGWQWVVFLRMLNGLGASALLPMMLIIIENWMPCDEISLGLTYAQVIQASLISLQPLISGYLCSIHWSYAFYVPCLFATCFLIIWLIVITDKPEKNKFISQKELDLICGYSASSTSKIQTTKPPQATTASSTTTITTKDPVIQNPSIERQTSLPEVYIEINTSKRELQRSVTNQNESTLDYHAKTVPNINDTTNDNLQQQQQVDQLQSNIKLQTYDEDIPQAGLIDILKVPVFYVYLIMWSVYCGSYSVFNFIMPSYLQQFLKIGISHNGFYCALIQTGCILSCLWPHPCLYLLQTKFKLSLTVARRITHLFLCSVVALSWAYVGLNHNNQLVFFFISRCFHGSNDIVATGTIMTNFSKGGVTALAFSMINTVGNLSVVFFSSLTGYVLDHTNQSVGGWSLIFMLGAACQILMMAIYSTVIRSEPIDFPQMKRKQLQKEFAKQQQKQQVSIKVA